MIRREATDGIHVHMKIIAHNKDDLVRWRLCQFGLYQNPARTCCTLKVFHMLIAKAASHSHTEHGHRKIVAIMELAVAFFHADMEDVENAHPPAESEPDRTVVPGC